MDEFAANGDVEELCIRYVSGPRNQPQLIFATTSEPSPYSSDHGEILAIIAMDLHGFAEASATLRCGFQRVRFTERWLLHPHSAYLRPGHKRQRPDRRL